jgi:hypothetical protein
MGVKQNEQSKEICTKICIFDKLLTNIQNKQNEEQQLIKLKPPIRKYEENLTDHGRDPLLILIG